MGVGNAPLLRANLLAAGALPDTPVVIVENGTREDERAFATTLADLTDCVAERSDRRSRRHLCRPRLGRRRTLSPRERDLHHRKRQSAQDRASAQDIANANVEVHAMSKTAANLRPHCQPPLATASVVFLDFEGAWSESLDEARRRPLARRGEGAGGSWHL